MDLLQQILNQFGFVFGDMVGNPLFLGILVFLTFIGVIILAKIRDDGRIMVIVPAGILALAFLPSWVASTVVMLVLGAILFYGLHRLVNR